MRLMMSKRFMGVVFCLTAFALRGDEIFTNARQYALSGAYAAAARGCEAIFINPANLGLPALSPFSMNLLGISADLSNNAWSHVVYQRYVGSYLNRSEVERILNAIPNEGFDLTSNAKLQGFSLGYGPFAFGVRAFSSYAGSFARELFELMAYGNELNRTYEFSPVSGGGMTLLDVGLAFGHGRDFEQRALRRLAWGVTARYLHGFSYARITESEFFTRTTYSSVAGEGHAVMNYAEGGRGYALTGAVSLLMDNGWVSSFVLHNPVSRLFWNRNARRTTFDFYLNETAFGRLVQRAAVDSIFITELTQEKADHFTAMLPQVLNVSLAAPFSPKYLAAAEFEVGFSETALSSRRPRIMAGGEVRLTPHLAVRAGVSYGGKLPNFFSGGFGLNHQDFCWDFSFRSYGGITSATSTGFGVATSLTLRIQPLPSSK